MATDVGAPYEPMTLACFDYYIQPEADGMSSTTKIGGKPTFCERAAHVASTLDRSCSRCSRQMPLLMQCYCPLIDGRNRMMYAFACNRSVCAAYGAESWRVYTVQCDVEDEDAEQDVEPESSSVQSSHPQRYDTNLPPAYLYVVPEPEKKCVEPTEAERALQERLLAAASQGTTGAEDEDAQQLEAFDAQVDLRSKDTDVAYEKFRRRIARQPNQVLRYQHNGVPIFMNPESTIYATIPRCASCGGPRCMELQIMPSILHFLKTDDAAEPGEEATDFGTVTVYTCAASCRAQDDGVIVMEEFVFVEPPPSIETEKADGKKTLLELLNPPLL